MARWEMIVRNWPALAAAIGWGLVAGLVYCSGPAAAHSWYNELEVPGAPGWRCCGDNDCAAYPHRTTDGEQAYEVFIRGKWWPVPPEKILTDTASPDGQVHACCFYSVAPGQPNGCEIREPVEFRCVIVPRGSV